MVIDNLSFEDRYSENFKLSELIEDEFVTGAFRKPILIGETSQDIHSNNVFPLYYYFPKKGKHNSLVIMINGFDEPKEGQDLYYSTKYSISKVLGNCKKRIKNSNRCFNSPASVLMPIPFHHWRKPLNKPYRHLSSAHMIDENKIRLFLGFRQIIFDVEKLIHELKNSIIDKKITNRFNSDFSIHLIGYSLGGLGALAIFLKDSLQEKNNIASCTLLSSGVSIGNASFKLTDLNSQQVKEVREYHRNKEFKKEVMEHINNFSKDKNEKLIYNLFKKIVLRSYFKGNYHLNYIDQRWEKLASRIPIITGEKDLIMNPRYIYTDFPKKATSLHITAINVKTHGLILSDDWKNSEAERTLKWASKLMARSI